jgi:hypothetical protein
MGRLLVYGVSPVVLYLPLLEVSVRLQRHSARIDAFAEPIWVVLWLGSALIGYVLIARRVRHYRVLLGLFYLPVMLLSLLYLGLVVGLYIDGEGP